MATITPSSKKILIVDDSLDTCIILAHILSKTYDIVIASSGTECLGLLEATKPDLILLDIVMPDLLGTEVCRRIRQHRQTSELPIIFVTSSTDDQTLAEAFLAGGNDFIRKPINAMELMLRVRAVFDQKELAARIVNEATTKSIMAMAGAICHELNQPLQVVAGTAELLLGQALPGSLQSKLASTIFDNTIKLGEITSQLMKITRYETKSYLGETRIVDIDKASSPGTSRPLGE